LPPPLRNQFAAALLSRDAANRFQETNDILTNIPMIQLTKRGVTGWVDVENIRQQFARTHTFRMSRLLHPDLIEFLDKRMQDTTWSVNVHDKISVEAVPDDPAIAAALNFLMNAPAFVEVMRLATGCEQISSFLGRVYRMAGSDHYDSWHNDISTEKRLVGISINLGRTPFEGGIFRLREESSGEVLCELPNTVQGDAIFFRISESLRHMVTPLEGTVPKTAFAGWFGGALPDHYATIRGLRPATSKPE
jgi:hypothetical protein